MDVTQLVCIGRFSVVKVKALVGLHAKAPASLKVNKVIDWSHPVKWTGPLNVWLTMAWKLSMICTVHQHDSQNQNQGASVSLMFDSAHLVP